MSEVDDMVARCDGMAAKVREAMRRDETVEVPVRWLEDLALVANLKSIECAYVRIHDRAFADASPLGVAKAQEERTAADWRRAIDLLAHEQLAAARPPVPHAEVIAAMQHFDEVLVAEADDARIIDQPDYFNDLVARMAAAGWRFERDPEAVTP